jgi:hypothetical protein
MIETIATTDELGAIDEQQFYNRTGAELPTIIHRIRTFNKRSS